MKLGIPWWSGRWDFVLPMQGVWVQSLTRIPHAVQFGQKYKIKNKQTNVWQSVSVFFPCLVTAPYIHAPEWASCTMTLGLTAWLVLSSEAKVKCKQKSLKSDNLLGITSCSLEPWDRCGKKSGLPPGSWDQVEPVTRPSQLKALSQLNFQLTALTSLSAEARRRGTTHRSIAPIAKPQNCE